MGTLAKHPLPFGDQVIAYVCPPLRHHRVVFGNALRFLSQLQCKLCNFELRNPGLSGQLNHGAAIHLPAFRVHLRVSSSRIAAQHRIEND